MIIESFDLASFIGGGAFVLMCILVFVAIAFVKGSNR